MIINSNNNGKWQEGKHLLETTFCHGNNGLLQHRKKCAGSSSDKPAHMTYL
jgi:hypothetical protein